jgi:3-deoxy-D-manno-octulosonic-acid transferase
MCEAKAIVQLPPVETSADAAELTHVLKNLLGNTKEREKLGRHAKQLVTDNQGAADRTIKLIAPLLAPTS